MEIKPKSIKRPVYCKDCKYKYLSDWCKHPKHLDAKDEFISNSRGNEIFKRSTVRSLFNKVGNCKNYKTTLWKRLKNLWK